jgi:hypothetical protein
MLNLSVLLRLPVYLLSEQGLLWEDLNHPQLQGLSVREVLN